MNKRQVKKNLKRQIEKLKSDNDLMRRIIDDSPSMSDVYDKFNQPLNVNISTIDLQRYQTKRFLMPLDFYDTNRLELIKEDVLKNLMNDIKNCINIELTNEYSQPTLTASIYIGRKRG